MARCFSPVRALRRVYGDLSALDADGRSMVVLLAAVLVVTDMVMVVSRAHRLRAERGASTGCPAEASDPHRTPTRGDGGLERMATLDV
jgi:hypothetical protein